MGRVMIVLMGVAIMSSMSANAHGSLLAYESFDYAAGSNLAGANGGAGFSAAYTKTGTTGTGTVTNSGMTYSGLTTNGKAAVVTADSAGSAVFSRSLSNQVGDDESQMWVSLLMQRNTIGGTGNGRTIGFTLTGSSAFNIYGEDKLTVETQDANSTWLFRIASGAAPKVDTHVSDNDVSLMLLRFDFNTNGTTDDAYLWIDPDLGAGEPDIASATATGSYNFGVFTQMSLVAAGGTKIGSINIDELRIGTTSADVGVVPEPSGLLLMVTGVIGLICFAWRKRK